MKRFHPFVTIRNDHRGNHPGHHHIHGEHSGRNECFNSHHVFHKQRLEDEEPKGPVYTVTNTQPTS
jgi:hypothetical protein